MIVVADSGPLHYLILIEQTALLYHFYGDVLIPEAVVTELTRARSPQPVKDWMLHPPPWLRPAPVTADEIALVGDNLDLGERAAIALAERVRADFVLIDETNGRAEAQRRHLRVTGTLGVLRMAAEDGLANVVDVLARLRATNFYVDEALIKRIFGAWLGTQLVGVDVGFSGTKATSGVATLAGDVFVVGRAAATAESRGEWLKSVYLADIVAIDAPLLTIVDSRVRACEQLFARGQFQRRCKPGFSHITGTGLALRNAGAVAAAQLEHVTSQTAATTLFPRVHAPRNVIEAFPNAFLGVCVSSDDYDSMPTLRRGRKFDWLYDRWCRAGFFTRLARKLESLLPHQIASSCETERDHEKRAALVCLLTGACVAVGAFVAVGESSGGYFFLPPWSLWADWARTELNKQRVVDAAVTVWIDGVPHTSNDALP